ncbi:MAG: YidC/Oxa1 family membrane protein insertase [Oscillospiraceae bacterium]|nr:YidC/Oxa1 family membrane protein insertase [Oscillospiraceae bacterium]
MWLVYQLFNNYGIAILIFTILVRLLLFPVSIKQQKSMAATSAIQPKLDKLKKQYANNPNKLQEEQMKLYAEENINPMASCLPMVLQLVLLYGVFEVIYGPITHIVRLGNDVVTKLKEVATPLYEGTKLANTFNARPELYIVKSVQENPQYFLDNGISQEAVNSILNFNNKLFGFIDLGTVPKSVFENGFAASPESIGLIMIPVIAGVLQLVTTLYSNAKQKKLNPEAAATMGSMNLVMYMFPVLSIYIGLNAAAGLGYYWIISSLVGIIQMIVLNKVYTPEYVQKLVEKDREKNKNKKRSGLMQKYNELMQQQLAAQNEQNNTIKTSAMIKDEDGNEIKMSNSQMKEYERKIIAEARRRQAEKYGDVYDEKDDKDKN